MNEIKEGGFAETLIMMYFVATTEMGIVAAVLAISISGWVCYHGNPYCAFLPLSYFLFLYVFYLPQSLIMRANGDVSVVVKQIVNHTRFGKFIFAMFAKKIK